jgi:hypothetical protein
MEIVNRSSLPPAREPPKPNDRFVIMAIPLQFPDFAATG